MANSFYISSGKICRFFDGKEGSCIYGTKCINIHATTKEIIPSLTNFKLLDTSMARLDKSTCILLL